MRMCIHLVPYYNTSSEVLLPCNNYIFKDLNLNFAINRERKTKEEKKNMTNESGIVARKIRLAHLYILSIVGTGAKLKSCLHSTLFKNPKQFTVTFNKPKVILPVAINNMLAMCLIGKSSGMRFSRNSRGPGISNN